MAECMLSLTRLLVSSPGLISLTLEDRSLDPISATAIVTSLGGYCVFPQLRVFRICWAGRIESESDNMDWDSFFTPPGHNAHPLRFFFMRHKGIEDLALGWTRESVYEGAIDPDDVARLFPSLKRFEGPAFLCNAITKSDLALNLERLSVVDDTFYGQTQWLKYATVLALSQAVNLSQLTIDGQTLVASGVSKELQSLTLGDWETTLTCVANYCGKLVAIESADGWMGRKMWEITRDESGNCTNILSEIF
ncbi:hypothetical protein FRC11_010234 [Ceratobasidium sp. 423]|nr:hypothetical protein FRC11_010234 [Ceratobasidium sp. 423]